MFPTCVWVYLYICIDTKNRVYISLYATCTNEYKRTPAHIHTYVHTYINRKRNASTMHAYLLGDWLSIRQSVTPAQIDETINFNPSGACEQGSCLKSTREARPSRWQTGPRRSGKRERSCLCPTPPLVSWQHQGRSAWESPIGTHCGHRAENVVTMCILSLTYIHTYIHRYIHIYIYQIYTYIYIFICIYKY